MIALKYFGGESPVSDADTATNSKAIDHIQKCPKCREWVHAIVPKDIMRRQERMTHYCCAGMFVACEEAEKRGGVHITFELFRGEDPCWIINGKRSFISYCPWCGKELPDKPFIS
jgi:hypothetical protein